MAQADRIDPTIGGAFVKFIREGGCSTAAEVDARRSLSENLGTESGESGSAATAVASPSVSADAYKDHESTSSVSHERS